ncbi:hypothetical protein CBM2599_A40214 [Cupriavidus taiwanensis]|nr:hypothetical protein CBM2599_A40214 [Cupriavidus taiwanensis]SOY89913.1 hypothetical protein CBM2600_A50217 [Cupriavidus taiwanensis]
MNVGFIHLTYPLHSRQNKCAAPVVRPLATRHALLFWLLAAGHIVSLLSVAACPGRL